MRRAIRSLAAATLLATVALVAGAVATGRLATVVTHGVSMQPTYHQGDLVIVGRADDYRPGDIVAYHDAAHDLTVLHRIIGGDAAGYILQGDNNESIDPGRPGRRDVIGRAVGHIPQGGRWLGRATSPPVLALIAFALLASGPAVVRSRRTVLRSRGRKRRATMSESTGRPAPAIAALSRLSPALRTVAGAAAGLGGLAVLLGAPAWTGPTRQPVPGHPPAAASMTFTYTAAVPKTPAYDTTVVHSPDPVFRKLARAVDIRFAYRGAPGTVAVHADLSTASGWHTTIALAAPTAFTANRYDAQVRLDLTTVDERAAAAAAVIGLPAGHVAIAVVPSVTTADGTTFAPPLRLTLAPLQLTLAGPAESLHATGPAAASPGTPIAGSTLTARTLALAGRQIMTVQAARTLSALLAGAALVLVLTLALATRRRPAPDEATALAHRYGSQLVPVDPIPMPASGTVVTVADLPTLARLAQRYELLILHWTTHGQQTFIVRDEATTYLYRHRPAAEAPTDPDTHAPAYPDTEALVTVQGSPPAAVR